MQSLPDQEWPVPRDSGLPSGHQVEQATCAGASGGRGRSVGEPGEMCRGGWPPDVGRNPNLSSSASTAVKNLAPSWGKGPERDPS